MRTQKTITVTVKLRSRKTSVEKHGEQNYTVRLTAAPIDNKANKQLVKLLARHFGIAQSCVSIAKGLTAKIKMVRILC